MKTLIIFFLLIFNIQVYSQDTSIYFKGDSVKIEISEVTSRKITYNYYQFSLPTLKGLIRGDTVYNYNLFFNANRVFPFVELLGTTETEAYIYADNLNEIILLGKETSVIYIKPLSFLLTGSYIAWLIFFIVLLMWIEDESKHIKMKNRTSRILWFSLTFGIIFGYLLPGVLFLFNESNAIKVLYINLAIPFIVLICDGVREKIKKKIREKKSRYPN